MSSGAPCGGGPSGICLLIISFLPSILKSNIFQFYKISNIPNFYSLDTVEKSSKNT